MKHRHLDAHKVPEAVPAEGPATRGRPVSKDKRSVYDDIIRAAELCLEHRTPEEISAKEIAAMAQVRPAMLHYYFGSKDGLLAEIIRRNINDIVAGFERLRSRILNDECERPTHAIVAQFAACYNEHPAACRLMVLEMLRQTIPTDSYFLEKWRAPVRTIVGDCISHLLKRGIYRGDFGAGDVIILINSAIFFPVIAGPYLSQEKGAGSYVLDERWINFVAEILDRSLQSELDFPRDYSFNDK